MILGIIRETGVNNIPVQSSLSRAEISPHRLGALRIGRRRFVTVALGMPFIGMISSAAATDGWSIFEEAQRGDPSLDYETVAVDPVKIADLSSSSTRAKFYPRDHSFPRRLLEYAGRQVGTNRLANREQIAAYLDLFDLPFASGGQPVPFCATGIAFVAAQAYATFWNPRANLTSISTLRESLPELDHYHFFPTPSVLDMYYVARGRRRWRDARHESRKFIPKPGYLVIYSFGREADHCGVVVSADANTLQTIEFNTSSVDQANGGAVAVRTRNYNDSVKGFIVTDAQR